MGLVLVLALCAGVWVMAASYRAADRAMGGPQARERLRITRQVRDERFAELARREPGASGHRPRGFSREV